MPLLAADLPMVQGCSTWVVENAKPARAALGMFGMLKPIRELEIHEIGGLNRDARVGFVKRALAGETIGLMSDAGCPGVADPGSELVALAHAMKCKVLPLVGPSSILLALMASGMNGQKFTFHGYPPVEPTARDAWLKQTEKESKRNKCTQIAIETPFRNAKLIEALCKVLEPETLMCMAWDVTGASEQIQTRTIAQWRKSPPEPGKFPCLFLWLSD